MAAKTSPEMLEARKMIEKGATAYRAAKDCGLTTSAITRSTWYRERVASTPAERSPMERAREMVTAHGTTAYEAAKITGVSQSSISRAQWYRDHVAANIAAGFPALAADALNNLQKGV